MQMLQGDFKIRKHLCIFRLNGSTIEGTNTLIKNCLNIKEKTASGMEDQEIYLKQAQFVDVKPEFLRVELLETEFLKEYMEMDNNNCPPDTKSAGQILDQSSSNTCAKEMMSNQSDQNNQELKSLADNVEELCVQGEISVNSSEIVKKRLQYSRPELLEMRKSPWSHVVKDSLIQSGVYPSSCILLEKVHGRMNLEPMKDLKGKGYKKKSGTKEMLTQSNTKEPFVPLVNMELVQLHRSENPWIPIHIMTKKISSRVNNGGLMPSSCMLDPLLLKRKKVVGILNRITFATFERFCSQLLDLEFYQHGLTFEASIINIIFKKAMIDDKYCKLHVKLLHMVATFSENRLYNEKQILELCDTEFRRINEDTLKYQETERKDTKGSRTGRQSAVTVENKSALRQDCLGVVRVIGNLYNLGFLGNRAIQKTILTLLENMHDLSYETTCVLLSETGEKFERESNYQPLPLEVFSSSSFMNNIFFMLEQLANGRGNKVIEISWMSRCAILNLIDLRNDGWIPRKTPDEIIAAAASMPRAAKMPKAKSSPNIENNWRKGVLPERTSSSIKTEIACQSGSSQVWRNDRFGKTRPKDEAKVSNPFANVEGKVSKFPPGPLREPNSEDNWRERPKHVSAASGENFKGFNRSDDIEGEIIYRVFRPTSNNNNK